MGLVWLRPAGWARRFAVMRATLSGGLVRRDRELINVQGRLRDTWGWVSCKAVIGMISWVRKVRHIDLQALVTASPHHRDCSKTAPGELLSRERMSVGNHDFLKNAVFDASFNEFTHFESNGTGVLSLNETRCALPREVLYLFSGLPTIASGGR